ncbi:MAG: molybdopterin molybdenumtransferase MoeA [Rhodobacteraceae bacterium]|nr:molybdopterin molybdenumtransferase MoeA [Paracoccaceae bacterium]
MQPPRLKNDCFALPPGIDWTPVDTALGLLRERLSVVTASERLEVGQAAGRVLGEDVAARRSNPPTANSAVDGFGFAHASLGRGAVQELPLVDGRAAAGQAFGGVVPEGFAIRILTGAQIPDGVDTVILEEDVTEGEASIAFHSGLKRGANTRRAGEDVAAGDIVLRAGRVLQPHDLALLAAVGVAEVAVQSRLRVGVLSTGDEIRPAGADIGPGQIYDANRPMLLALLARWGMAAVDLGHVRDDRDLLRARLDRAADEVDAILTSGGVSAGDEDHLSALLNAEGRVHSWRIAVKPGRPLALGQWQGVPVFGLPGNPVAAFVCALIFARPALAIMNGADWPEPVGMMVPAGFAKSKKPGRREYLRARLDGDGRAEVFRSEGSGRISGLSWAEGLVELDDAAAEIAPGDPVRFLPYGSFGL